MIRIGALLVVTLLTWNLCSATTVNDDLMNKLETLNDDIDYLKTELENEVELNKQDESEMLDNMESESVSSIFRKKDNNNNNKRDATDGIPYRCGFEGDCFEDFETEGDKLTWKKQVSSRYAQDRMDPKGYLMHAQITKANTRAEYAYLRTEFTVQKNAQCGEFYYLMYNRGCDAGRLLVTMKCGQDDAEELFRGTGNFESKWIPVNFDIKKAPGTKCTITWRVSKGLSDEGRVSIDDVAMYYEACRAEDEPHIPEHAECNLHYQTCGWTPMGDTAWGYSRHRTSTASTGPDRPFGSYSSGTGGVYAFLEASDKSANDAAILMSPELQSTRDQCMRYMVNMYGSEMGSFEATVITAGNRKSISKWTGDQGKNWFEGYISLPVNQKFQVELKAVRGTGEKSDIALDDIIVQEGSCDSQPVLGTCYDFDDKDVCKYTDDTCGAETKEFKHLEVTQVEKGNLIGTIGKISKEYSLTFEVKPKTKISGWTNILRFTTSTTDCCGIGNRIPALFLRSRSHRVHACQSLRGSGNYCTDYNLNTNAWNKIEFTQTAKTNGRYEFIMKVNNRVARTVENHRAQEFKNVEVYIGDSFYNPADAEVKNLVHTNTGDFEKCNALCNGAVTAPAFVNRPADPPVSLPAVIQVTKGRLISKIPTIAPQWKFSFEVKPKGLVGGWNSILHVTTDHNCCNYGRRTPGVWFHSRTTKLLICNSISNNGNKCFTSEAIAMNTFTKLEFEQKLVNGVTTYTIKINGIVFKTLTNTTPKELKDIEMYAGDPWHNAANAEVRNVRFENLVPTFGYPCPDMCKPLIENQKVNSGTARVITYDPKRCKDKDFVTQIKLPSGVSAPRLACFVFDYKLGNATRNPLRCNFEVKMNGNHRLFRLEKFELNKWKHVVVNVNRPMSFGEPNIVGVQYKTSVHCPTLSFANMKLFDGPCKGDTDN